MKTKPTEQLTESVLLAYLFFCTGQIFLLNWLIHISGLLAVLSLTGTLLFLRHRKEWAGHEAQILLWRSLYLLGFSAVVLLMYVLYLNR